MVWGLFPVDPLSGEDKYYIFTKGVYKVGRKGCDVIICKDKGVSRIHAELVVDEMISMDHPLHMKSDLPSRVLIRDCSKYGTYINKEKVHKFLNKETSLKDGDVVSFGTGTAVYRFCFVPLVFFVYCSESFQVDQLLRDKVSSIEKRIGLEIPSWSSYIPTLTVEGVSVKVAASGTRAKCLEGFTCLLESINMYKFKDRLQSLLEVCGAKIVLVEEFCSNAKGLDCGQDSHVVCVIPRGSPDKFNLFNKLGSLSRVNELDLLRAVLAGHLDLSVLVSPSVLVSSSCSTDETVVADSEAEVETPTSEHFTADISNEEAPKYVNKLEMSIDPHLRSENNHVVSSTYSIGKMTAKRETVDEAESGNSDIIYSQDLIIRDLNLPAQISSTPNNEVLNFKRFRKGNTQSGNSFNNLIPFSKYPYKDFDYGNQDMLESVKEEKRRKQMEAIAEDLFNTEKGRRRGVAGSLHVLLTRG
ncbi:nibrin homolog isoform X2 [Populus trichocarpa]|uniref:nibrin homolog isoform X2 n=1 Tax=Populus trichocarpa TaxID=3694 RepID=UPI002277EEE7|nr:nibrin homolog isoform X2 [Populus trichocarpa]